MIGLVDLDLQQSSSSTSLIPNLEIMKLATYYRLEENTFCRLISLNEKELSQYDKIYFFSEANKFPNIPEAFLRADNVIYGGTAFTEKYIPFKNSIIDFTIPRLSIYKDFLKEKYNNGVRAKIIEHVLEDSYYRIYAGEEILPLPPIRKNKRVFIYDKDLLSRPWQDIINSIALKKPSGIHTIHPIICRTITDFKNIRNCASIARGNEIILDFNIPLEEVPYLLKNYEKFFLAEIVKTSNIFLTLGGNFNSTFKYYKDLIYKMNLLYSFWSKKIPIKIKYIEPSIGVKDCLKPLSSFIATWSNNIENKQTINERITYKNKKKISEAMIARDNLLKFHPTAQDLFNQTFKAISERRYWRI